MARFSRTGSAAALAAATALALPAAAAAQGNANGQGDGQRPAPQRQAAQQQQPPPAPRGQAGDLRPASPNVVRTAPGGTLPFTGIDSLALALIGLLLAALGVALRRRALRGHAD